MRARITYLLLSPATPRRIARAVTTAGGLTAGSLLLAGLSTGAVSHVLFSALVAL